jgi:hypothetical protein
VKSITKIVEEVVRGRQDVHFLPGQEEDYHKVHDVFFLITTQGDALQVEMRFAEILNIETDTQFLDVSLMDKAMVLALQEKIAKSQAVD